MTSAESVVQAIVQRRSSVLRYMSLVTVAVGIFLCWLGYFMGRTHLRLILTGRKTQGTIVAYHRQTFTNRRTGYMPVVEYRASGDNKVRFQDWLGRRIEGSPNQLVEVLYDPASPTVAMIDRPIWNWIPWAPIISVGLLLILSGIRRAIAGG